MALVVGSNSVSLNIQKNLNRSSVVQNEVMQRLSSGLRINSTKDDAAGLQISNRLTSQVNGLNVATQNAYDGISIAQVAEGALNESSNILHRMRDMALQAANGVYSDQDRSAMEQEISQLKKELNRISDTTSFGKRKLLNGTFGTEQFQVGSGAFEVIGMSLNSFHSSDMGFNNYRMQENLGNTTTVTVTNSPAPPIDVTGFGGISFTTPPTNTLSAAANVNLSIDGILGKTDFVIANNASAKDVANAINQFESKTGVEAHAQTKVVLNAFPFPTGPITDVTGSYVFNEPAEMSFELRGRNVLPEHTSVIRAVISDTEDMQPLVIAVNQAFNTTGISAQKTESGGLALISKDGENIQIENVFIAFTDAADTAADIHVNGSTYGVYDESFSPADAIVDMPARPMLFNGGVPGFYETNATFTGAIELSADHAFSITSDTPGIAQGSNLEQLSDFETVEELNVAKQLQAQRATFAIDAGLTYIDKQRSQLGAVQNRFSNTIANLQNISENLSVSRSRIQDADFALETANITKVQILQQASTSVLAQANEIPQAALDLMGL